MHPPQGPQPTAQNPSRARAPLQPLGGRHREVFWPVQGLVSTRSRAELACPVSLACCAPSGPQFPQMSRLDGL